MPRAVLDPAGLTAHPIAGTTDTGWVDRGTETYYLTTWTTTSPEPCSDDERGVTLHDGFAEVSYFERTITATLAAVSEPIAADGAAGVMPAPPVPVQPRTTG